MGYQYGETNDMIPDEYVGNSDTLDHFADINKMVEADFRNTCILASAYFLDLSQCNFTASELVEFVAIIKRAKDDLHKLIERSE
jgi:hypothetical protein